MGSNTLYEIRHISRYLYPHPARNCVLSLCLKPGDGGGQRLLSFDLVSDPTSTPTAETDFLGNTKHLLTIHRQHQALEVTSRSLVERSPSAPLPDSLEPGAWDEIRSWEGSFDFWALMNPSGFARPSAALTAFVAGAGIEVGPDPLQTLLRLSDTLHDSFEYVQGSTSAGSPIDHVLESRQGVCQDYAHVMIAIVRSWHIPARYVSGYMYVDSYGGEPEPQETHAWVECLLPALGWVGFDPTNRSLSGQGHVRVAVGRDYQDVAPIRGVFMGGAESRLDVDVRVRRVEPSAS